MLLRVSVLLSVAVLRRVAVLSRIAVLSCVVTVLSPVGTGVYCVEAEVCEEQLHCCREERVFSVYILHFACHLTSYCTSHNCIEESIFSLCIIWCGGD